MTITTRAQRVALKRVYDRGPIIDPNGNALSFKQFLKGVYSTFGCDNAVTVKWCGMWLCIETDGYCHS